MSAPGVDLQEKIAAARREADGLKDQIRSRKEKMADTSCKSRLRYRIDILNTELTRD